MKFSDQQELTYSSSEVTPVVSWRCCWERWLIEKNGEREREREWERERVRENRASRVTWWYIYIYIYILPLSWIFSLGNNKIKGKDPNQLIMEYGAQAYFYFIQTYLDMFCYFSSDSYWLDSTSKQKCRCFGILYKLPCCKHILI